VQICTGLVSNFYNPFVLEGVLVSTCIKLVSTLVNTLMENSGMSTGEMGWDVEIEAIRFTCAFIIFARIL
jgi:hypothetical protein